MNLNYAATLQCLGLGRTSALRGEACACRSSYMAALQKCEHDLRCLQCILQYRIAADYAGRLCETRYAAGIRRLPLRIEYNCRVLVSININRCCKIGICKDSNGQYLPRPFMPSRITALDGSLLVTKRSYPPTPSLCCNVYVQGDHRICQPMYI